MSCWLQVSPVANKPVRGHHRDRLRQQTYCPYLIRELPARSPFPRVVRFAPCCPLGTGINSSQALILLDPYPTLASRHQSPPLPERTKTSFIHGRSEFRVCRRVSTRRFLLSCLLNLNLGKRFGLEH